MKKTFLLSFCRWTCFFARFSSVQLTRPPPKHSLPETTNKDTCGITAGRSCGNKTYTERMCPLSYHVELQQELTARKNLVFREPFSAPRRTANRRKPISTNSPSILIWKTLKLSGRVALTAAIYYGLELQRVNEAGISARN